MDCGVYTPLPQQPGAIRLLRLFPNSDAGAPIHCSLLIYILEDLGGKPHLYEALSYAWGDPDKTVEITVSGFSINITENTHAALRRLRDHYFERILWIDALCIDQSNKQEVATQFLFMARIYSEASRVLVWLGEAANGSDIALENLRLMNHGPEKDTNHRIVVRHLLERPWFRRVWVSSFSCPRICADSLISF